MKNSTALGFYARHSTILDELWEAGNLEDEFQEHAEAEQLPHELREVVRASVEPLNRVIGMLDAELWELQAKILERITKNIGGAFTISKTKREAFLGKLRLRPADKRNTRAKTIEIGWDWWTVNDSSFIFPFVWMGGGRRAESVLSDYFSRISVEADIPDGIEDWASGSFVLPRVNLTALSTADFELDVENLVSIIVSRFSWLNQKSLTALFERSREI